VGASAKRENMYFYEQKKCRTVGGNCGTGHTCGPLPTILKDRNARNETEKRN